MCITEMRNEKEILKGMQEDERERKRRNIHTCGRHNRDARTGSQPHKWCTVHQ